MIIWRVKEVTISFFHQITRYKTINYSNIAFLSDFINAIKRKY